MYRFQKMESSTHVAGLACAALMLFSAWGSPGFGAEPVPERISSGTRDAVSVSVDPRVELISIIFRLAGNNEYIQGRVPSYNRDTEEHFAPYREHPVVTLASKLYRTRGVSFNAPMSVAVYLEDSKGLKGRVPLDPIPEMIDSRWQADELREFLEKARDFAEVSDFDGFFNAHKPLFSEATARMKELIEREGRLDWFDDFFGARPGSEFRIILGMTNGGCCYGASVRINEKEEIYCILGVWECDPSGVPRFKVDMLSTVVHEFCHSYVNPVVYAHSSDLRKAGERLFPRVQAEMRRMAYGDWVTTTHESLVRASVVRCVSATRGEEAAERQIKEEIGNGFYWMRELCELIPEYETGRDKYPTFDSFFPRIVEFFNEYSENAPTPAPTPTLEGAPTVVEMLPENGAQNVDPELKELRVVFSVEMAGSYAWCGGGPEYPTIVEGQRPRWLPDKKTCVLPVVLKPNWEYRLWLNAPSFTGFRSADHVPLVPVTYTFRTGLGKNASE